MKAKYQVVLMDDRNEYILLETEDIERAKDRARDEAYYIERENFYVNRCRNNDAVEIRLYDADGMNYDTVGF